MRVSLHFSVSEFAQPARHGFARVEYPAEWVESRLRPLADALEHLRAHFGGRAVRILSGYRTSAYNAKIDGARHSQHVEGRASDVVVAGVSSADVFEAVRANAAAWGVGGVGLYPSFTHVDVRKGARLAVWGRGAGNRDAEGATEKRGNGGALLAALAVAGVASVL